MSTARISAAPISCAASPDGCYAEVILEEPLLETLRTGKAATFIVFQTPEEGIGIPVDLDGFGEGFDALP